MKIYQYKSYEDYVQSQTEANIIKINNIWIEESIIQKIINHVKNANFILCHGVRNGAEINLFEKYYPKAKIIGTEISYTAANFRNTVQHDFNKIKNEWINKFDIVYSNSFDHTYDPKLCLSVWREQLNENGIMFIELPTGQDNKSRKWDPLEIEQNEFEMLLEQVKLKKIKKETGIIKKENSGSILYTIEKIND